MTMGEPNAILHNLIIFGRYLRRSGLRVDPARQVELAGALSLIDMGRREDFRSAARAVVVTKREDLAVFDRAFNEFWAALRGETELTSPFPSNLLNQAPGETGDDGEELPEGARAREV